MSVLVVALNVPHFGPEVDAGFVADVLVRVLNENREAGTEPVTIDLATGPRWRGGDDGGDDVGADEAVVGEPAGMDGPSGSSRGHDRGDLHADAGAAPHVLGRVQTRSGTNDLAYFATVAEAFAHARDDGSVWKISWTEGDYRIRMIRSVVRDGGWDYRPFLEEFENLVSGTPASEICGWCGMTPAAGWAAIETVRFCHGDDDRRPTCYERAQPFYYANLRAAQRPSTPRDILAYGLAEQAVAADDAIDGEVGTYEVGE